MHELSFCSRFKLFVLIVSKLLDLLFFLQSRMQVFHNQKTFPLPRKTSVNMEIIHCQGDFLQKKNYLVKEIFHKQWSFLQWRKFSTKKIYMIKEIFCKQESFQQFFFPLKAFSINIHFYTVKKIFCKQQSKRFCKKI